MNIAVRLMTRQDVPQVTKIDREAFPEEWPPTNFGRELTNKLAHYIVAYEVKEIQNHPTPVTPEEKKASGILERLKNIFARKKDKAVEELPPVLGYAGMWILADEAHITSIASSKEWRHKGIGEILLINLIELAIQRKASAVTLEVRVSNQIAQNLYLKFGFDNVGLRKGYYLNNREDAIIMTTDYIGSPTFAAKFEQIKQAHNRRWGTYHTEIAA